MYFSIAAPQNLALPDGTVLSFRVNAANSALVEIHIVGKDGQDVAGTHILTFNRNGGPSDTQFVPTPDAPVVTAAPEKPYPYVDKDAVRADDWEKTPSPSAKSAKVYGDNAKPSGDNKPAA